MQPPEPAEIDAQHIESAGPRQQAVITLPFNRLRARRGVARNQCAAARAIPGLLVAAAGGGQHIPSAQHALRRTINVAM